MCRLLGVVSKTQTDLPQAIGASFSSFVDLSQVHHDGWGLSWRDASGELHRRRGLPKAAEDPTFNAAIDEATGSELLLHLRWATPGMTVEIENCHPFTDGTISFAHNGSFTVSEQLRADLLEWDAWEPQGSTDSELYFALVRHFGQTMSWPDALCAAIQRITADEAAQQLPGLPGLNAMLIADDGMYVASYHDNSRLLSFQPRDYSQLWLKRDAERVIFASSNWELPDHEDVDNLKIFHIAPDLQITEYPVA